MKSMHQFHWFHWFHGPPSEINEINEINPSISSRIVLAELQLWEVYNNKTNYITVGRCEAYTGSCEEADIIEVITDKVGITKRRTTQSPSYREQDVFELNSRGKPWSHRWVGITHYFKTSLSWTHQAVFELFSGHLRVEHIKRSSNATPVNPRGQSVYSPLTQERALSMG